MWIPRPPDLPVTLQLHEHLAIRNAQKPCIGRYVDVLELAITHVQVIQPLEKARRTVGDVVAVIPIPGSVNAGRDIRLLPGEDLRGLLDRLTALP